MTCPARAVHAALAATLSLTVAYGQDEDLIRRAPANRVFERQLIEQTREAYEATSFEARNALGSQAVSGEATALIGRVGESGVAELERVFRLATQQAGQAFQPAFTPDGQPIKANEAAYEQAMSEARGVALRALGPPLELAVGGLAQEPGGATEVAERAVAQGSIHDLAKIVAYDLRLREVPLGGERLIEWIDFVVPESDPYRQRGEIDKLRVEATATPLDFAGLITLSIGSRLTHSTRKVGLVHRAAWEGTPRHVTPGPQSPLDTYDALMIRLFSSAYAAERTRLETQAERTFPDVVIKTAATEAAFARVVFEAWKDVLELKQAYAESRLSEASLAAHERARGAFNQRLSADRAAELRGLSTPQLLARARVRRIELEPGMTRAEILARLGVGPATRAAPEAGPRVAKTTGMLELLERELPRGAAERAKSKAKSGRGRGR